VNQRARLDSFFLAAIIRLQRSCDEYKLFAGGAGDLVLWLLLAACGLVVVAAYFRF